jgi:Flp pilus assembly protein TadG
MWWPSEIVARLLKWLNRLCKIKLAKPLHSVDSVTPVVLFAFPCTRGLLSTGRPVEWEYAMYLRSFRRNESGAIFPIFGLVGIVALLCAGMATDYARLELARSELQSALDAGALAAARRFADGEAEMQVAGQSYFASTLQTASMIDPLPVPVFTRTGSGVNASVSTAIKTKLMQIAGFDEMPISVQSGATASGKGMELMLVVDVSGSMSDAGKIGALRTAATALVDTIYGNSETRADTWIGITPFSGRVNIVDYGAAWLTGAGPGWAGKLCTHKRSSPNVENDAPPSVELFPHYFALEGYGGFDGTRTCPGARALGLTAEKSVISARIQTLSAQAGTSTQVGMVWGWRMLSPRWRGLWGDPAMPLDSVDSPGKYVIIMTDGENFPWESDDPELSTDDADQRLLRECTAMKAEGITIFTVAFDMGATLTSLYQSCASQPDYHFDVQANSDLIETFETLGLTIAGHGSHLTH